MKRIIASIAILILLVSIIPHSHATELQLLSSMSEDECIEFVKQNDIVIPDDYDETTWGPFIKEIIALVEENPDYEFAINYTVTMEFAEEIKDAVNNYYGIDSAEESDSNEYSVYSIVSLLQDSDVAASWAPVFGTFNCYVYAIGVPVFAIYDPGFTSGHSFDLSMSLGLMAQRVQSDLISLGHQRVVYDDSFDLSNLCINEQIICFRRGMYDYHFMRYNNGAWYHKPGRSTILRYKYTPSVMRVWTNECAYSYVKYEATLTYNSDIYFFSIDGHDWEYTSNNNGTHSKHCDICGDTITTACNINYNYKGSNQHQGSCTTCSYTTSNQACTYSYTGNGNGTHERVCTLCGNSMNLPCEVTYEYLMYSQHRAECTVCADVMAEDCVAVPTYCGNGSTQHIHADACQDCGNAMSSATESCTLQYIFAGTINGTNTHSQVCAECEYVHIQSAACFYKNSNYCFFCGTHKDTVQAASFDEIDTKE